MNNGPQFLVLTILGADRPGLVQRLSDTIAAHDGNWLESRMSHLGGQFAGILRIAVSADQEAALADALRGLVREGINVHFQSGSEGAATQDAIETTRITVTSPDRPGIVRDVTAALARIGANVEELHTETAPAPFSSEPLFRAEAALGLPAGTSEEDVRAALESLDPSLIVDVGVDAVAKEGSA